MSPIPLLHTRLFANKYILRILAREENYRIFIVSYAFRIKADNKDLLCMCREGKPLKCRCTYQNFKLHYVRLKANL